MRMFNLFVLLFFGVVFVVPAQANFTLPDYQKFTLDNGLTVFLMPQHEVPLIDVQLVVKAGAINDGEYHGLANITNEAMFFGAGGYSKAQLTQQLDFLGAHYQSITSKENSVISLSFASKDQVTLLPLFASVIQQPHFNQQDFNKYQQRYLSLLTQQKESPKSVIKDAFARSYFAQHPYGNAVLGTQSSAQKINIKQVKGFYQRYYTPDNSALVIVGDFKITALKQRIQQLFSAWHGQKSKNDTLPSELVAPKQARVLLINKPDAHETTFMIGGKGVSVNNPDRVSLSVINTILGGRFTSWLNDALRVSAGLTYGARSSFVNYSNSGLFYISTFTKTDTTFEAIDLALNTYEKLWTQGIDQATLKSAKAYVKGQFPPRYETFAQLASLLSKMWSLGLSDSYINDFEKNVDALTVTKANQLVKKYFPHKNLQFVLIGKADVLRKQAANYGKVSEKEITAL